MIRLIRWLTLHRKEKKMIAKDELQQMFCEKLDRELQKYKRKILNLPPWEIYDRAYNIEITMDIYELLLQMSEGMDRYTMKRLIVMPNLLGHMYMMWLKKEDSLLFELEDCLHEQIVRIHNGYHSSCKEDREVIAV